MVFCGNLNSYLRIYVPIKFFFVNLKYKNVQYLFLIQPSSLLQYKLFLSCTTYHECFIGKCDMHDK